MMDKARKKFILYAEAVVLVLLTVLLSVINTVNFAMVSDDADIITDIISKSGGAFPGDRYGQQGDDPPSDFYFNSQVPGSNYSNGNNSDNVQPPDGVITGTSTKSSYTQVFSRYDTHSDAEEQPTVTELQKRDDKRFGRGMGPMGPFSEEISASLRYFTFAFDEEGTAEKIAFKISAETEENAREWAKSLLGGSTTGWTKSTYRYRLYEKDGKNYVTVIDQGRELLPCYRILIISVCGGIGLLVLSFVILAAVGKKLFKPLEESDRKQKQFIAQVEKDFRMPLTVINANTELLERENGPSEASVTIDRQVRKMTMLVRDLSNLSVSDQNKLVISEVNLSDIVNRCIDQNRDHFVEKGITITTQTAPDIMIKGDEAVLTRVFEEIMDNTLKFAGKTAGFRLFSSGQRITFEQSNQTDLPEGSADQIFDRFTRLGNAENTSGAGLGLAFVKQAVKAHDGRVSAVVNNGIFTLRIDL